jgi:nucleoside 2-deoxyribosyltransferase
MKIYTAATFAEQKRIRAHKEKLIQMGHQVVATWLEEPPVRPEGMSDEIFEKKMAMKDLQEVASADCLILDVENPSKTSGKMVETGFALAKHKLVYVVGTPPPHAIFLTLADAHFKTWDDLFLHIGPANRTHDWVQYSQSVIIGGGGDGKAV